MMPTWKHGVAGGMLVSAFIGLGALVISLSENPVVTTESTEIASALDLVKQQQISSEPFEVVAPIELPFGGRQVLPNYRFVALYGTPAYASLGSLGEQPLEQAITRAKDLAQSYQQYSEEKIIPTFEIITTVASAGATENQDYSQELDPAKIKPWIDAAREQGIYVILDLQPGRTSFLDQAKQYEELLKEPHVGLALDPEWRLLSLEARHLVKIGAVSSEEINQTSAWLADVVRVNKLPQKIFMIHQFTPSMILNRKLMDISRKDELGFMIHVDGFGDLGSKIGTWNRIKEGLPSEIYLGWKNFYDEDLPTPTPEQTMAQIPKPWFISYQ